MFLDIKLVINALLYVIEYKGGKRKLKTDF